MQFTAPLRFMPIYQPRIWGGRRLATVLGRELPRAGTRYGESWEISDRPEAQSVVRGGEADGLTLHELWAHHRRAVFGAGAQACASERFPLLMKILDACDDLSIQVHPPEAVAASLGGEAKTEMWYVAGADPGARLLVGLRPGITREAFLAALQEGNLPEVLQVIEPRPGDSCFIPSGRVHAIGKGVLVYEIQQNSDTTYRLFDWNRLGPDGRPRPLHVAESLACIDFADRDPALQPPGPDGLLVRCPQFDVRLQRDAALLGQTGEGVTVAVVRGELEVASQTFKFGDFAVLPADMPPERRRITAKTADAEWLEVRLPWGSTPGLAA